MFKSADLPACGLDDTQLKKELNKVKARAFIGKNAAFLGPLMCTLDFVWTLDMPTAGTNGLTLWWNPHFFMSLDPRARETVLLHELWHVGYLHMLRLGTRDPETWNEACDIVINNGLEKDGYSFVGIEDCWKDRTYDGMSAEQIYNVIYQQKQQMPPPQGAGGGAFGQSGQTPSERMDMFPSGDKERQKVVTNVVKAVQTAKISGQPGAIPGDLQEVIKDFLSPKIDWRKALSRFFTDICKSDYTWTKRNRRYRHVYMPSMQGEGRLQKLFYYLDVSGSVSPKEIRRFNSEVAYIKKVFNPVELWLITFDTRITATHIFKEGDTFEKLVVVGRGGTSFYPVRAHILEHKPTAAVIFSDMYVDPMLPVGNIPVIWVAINNSQAQVPFGKIIHIKE